MRTLTLAKLRSPLRTRCVCTAAAASTPAIATRSGPMFSSVRNSSVQPARTACSASKRMRRIASRSVSGSPPDSKVQSITVDWVPKCARSRSQSAQVSTGLSSTSTRPGDPSVSRMLARLPKRVRSDITWRSRRESIGGLVTWLKFWRKNWLISPRLVRYHRERRIVAHRSHRFLGGLDHRAEHQLHILERLPGGNLAARQLGAVVARQRRLLRPGQVGDGDERADLGGIIGLGRDPVLHRAVVQQHAFVEVDRDHLAGAEPPLAITLVSGTATMPVSDPTISSPSAVWV